MNRTIEEDEKLCREATDGGWSGGPVGDGDKILLRAFGQEMMTPTKIVYRDAKSRQDDIQVVFCGDMLDVDLAFTTEARQALPYWLEEVRRLRKALSHIAQTSSDDDSAEVARAILAKEGER